jgi:hypothetical protein
MGLRDLLFGKRDTLTQTTRLIGFPENGGLVASGVSATTTLTVPANVCME